MIRNKFRISSFAIYLFPILLFLIISVQVILPFGSIVAGGDFYQLSNYQTNVSRYVHSWFNQIGQGGYNPLVVTYPFYLLLSWIEMFFGTHMVAFFTLFLFLTASYFSFNFSAKYLIPAQSRMTYIFPALLYSLNNFVITIFSYPWGFTHHFLLYPFLPLLVVTYLKMWLPKARFLHTLCIFLIVVIFALPAMNNVAFIFLLYLFELMLVVSLLLVKTIEISIRNVYKFVGVMAAQLAIHIWLVIPHFITIFGNKTVFTDSEALGGSNYLEGWIRSTSSNFLNVLTLTMDQYKYPYIFKHNSLLFFIVLSFALPILLIYLLTMKNKKRNVMRVENMLIRPFSLLFIAVGTLAVRLFSPWDIVLKYVYLSPFFIFFRSPDKIFLILPVIYCIIIFFLLVKKRINTKIICSTFFCLLVPWMLPIVRFLLEADYNRFAQKQKPEYSYIVSIPEEYKQAASIINSDANAKGVVSLPYSVINSINWSNYPKWKYVGHDVLHLYFNVPYISSNTFDNLAEENAFSFKLLSEYGATKNDVIGNLQRFGANYIIYHKDIAESWITENVHLRKLIDELVMDESLALLIDNQYFSLYALQNISTPETIESNIGKLKFKKLNPTLYIISDDIHQSDKTLHFRQSYDPAWKLYTTSDVYRYMDGSGDIPLWKLMRNLLSQLPLGNHYQCLEFANCWDIRGNEQINKGDGYILFYSYQLLVYGLQMTSGLILILCFGFLFHNKKQ